MIRQATRSEKTQTSDRKETVFAGQKNAKCTFHSFLFLRFSSLFRRFRSFVSDLLVPFERLAPLFPQILLTLWKAQIEQCTKFDRFATLSKIVLSV